MLEDADAMKAHAQLHGTYNESPAKGRPVLHAALQAEKLVGELVSWAAQMPLFATQIIGQSRQTESALYCSTYLRLACVLCYGVLCSKLPVHVFVASVFGQACIKLHTRPMLYVFFMQGSSHGGWGVQGIMQGW